MGKINTTLTGSPPCCWGQWGLGLMIAALLMWGAGVSHAQESPVSEGASVEKIAGDFEFTEGPIWFDGALLFSDIPANTVYRWTVEDGVRSFLQPSGHANGLAVGVDGHLLLAQHDGQVGRRAADGSVTALVQSYEGQRLNSPNDLTVAEDGTIYFTDPPYGVEEDERALSFSGVYRLDPDGTLTLLTKAFERPNGIVLSPDEETLYVNDSRASRIWTYEVGPEGGIENKQVFATPTDAAADGTTDGMTVDAQGRLYTTGPGGLWIYAPDGTRLDRVPVPEAPTNVTLGGPEGETLYITARPNVYRLPIQLNE